MRPIHERLPTPVRYALAVSIFAVALAVRFAVLPVEVGLAFLTFYPAAVVGFYLCGAGPGALLVVASAITGFYCFTPPFFTWEVSLQGALATSIFTMSAAMIGAIIHRMQRITRQLSDAQRDTRTVVESIQDGMLLMDRQATILSCNTAAQQLLGFEGVDLRGVSSHDPRWRVFSEDSAQLKPDDYPATRAIRTGRFEPETVVSIQLPDGRWRWLRVNAVPVKELDGSGAAVVMWFSDVTASKTAAKQLRDVETRFRLMVDGVADYGIFTLDAAGTVQSWNRGAERMKGYTADEAIGRHFSMFYSDEDRRLGKPVLELQIAAQTGHYEEEGWRLRKDGSRFWASVLISAIRNDAGELIGYAKVSRDLSERRAAEERLRISEERHRSLVAGIADGVVSIDASGRVHSINPAAERIFDVKAEAVIGRNVKVLMPERFRRDHDLNVARFAAQVDPRLIGLRREVVGMRRDGSEFPMMLALSVVPDDKGASFVALVTDLTEQKRSQRAIEESRRRLNAMIECAPFSIITSDADGLVDTMNPAAERLTLYSRNDLIGKLVAPLHDPEEVKAKAIELSKVSGRHVEPGFETFTHYARRGLTDENDWTYVRKDGTRVSVHLAVSALRGPEEEITGYMGIAFDISERQRREEYTRHIAHHDQLTGLPMRSLLNDRLEVALARARREHSKVGVIMLDLDHFKRVNDSLGHHVGDELLRTVAQRLVTALRGSDTVSRMGGDEFVILIPDVDEATSVERVAAQLLARVGKPVVLGSHEIAVTPSIGIALFPDHGDSPHELLKNADSAMYHVKSAGRHGYRIFSRELERAVSMKLEMESDLRRAMERGILRLHYQPIVNLDSGDITGMEALLRWKDPVRGDVPPAEFVAVAEESGLILALGEWVMRMACREARMIQQQTGRPLRVAVNLSPRQFMQDSLMSMITSALLDASLAPDCLEVEITEGVLMEDTVFALERLNQLRALGVTIAIDDFGTGFSSLAYITRFPIDTLKIDRSFIAKVGESVNDAAVAQAIVALARSLKVRVVAEGVETSEQLAFLRDRCCDAAQGYLLGPPTAPEFFSVQGFHFAAACSAEDFGTSFGSLLETSGSRVRRIAG